MPLRPKWIYPTSVDTKLSLSTLFNLSMVLDQLGMSEESADVGRQFLDFYPDHPNAADVRERIGSR